MVESGEAGFAGIKKRCLFGRRFPDSEVLFYFMRSYYYVFILVYALILLLMPHLGEIGYEGLRESIFGGEPRFPLSIYPEIGRFYLLSSQEYNLLLRFSGSIFWFYAFNVVQFLLFSWVLVRLLTSAGATQPVAYGISTILFLHPAFTNVWVGFSAAERNLIFFSAIFLFCYTAFLERPKIRYLVAGVLVANLALYYKEPAFLMIGAFAFLHLLIAWKAGSWGQKVFDMLLMAGGAIFLIAYYFVVYRHRGAYLYGDTAPSGAMAFVKNLGNFGVNDPIVAVLAVALIVWRMHRFVFRGVKLHPLYDPMLLGGVTYFLVFLKLNMYAVNYLLPAYVFVLPPLVYFAKSEGLLKVPVVKLLAGFVVFLLVFNVIPLGLHIMSQQKFAPVNTILAMNALADDIKRRGEGRPSIFLDGVYPEVTAHPASFAYDRDAYYNVGQAMVRRGLAPERFDLKSELPRKDAVFFGKEGLAEYPYTVFNSDKISRPSTGDYLLIVPTTTKEISNAYLRQLEENYTLIFRTPFSYLEIPNLSLKSQIKRFVPHDGKLQRWMSDENTMRLPAYYIFIKK